MAFKKQMLENIGLDPLPLPNLYDGFTAGAFIKVRPCERCGVTGPPRFVQIDQKRWLVFCVPCFGKWEAEFKAGESAMSG